MIISTMINLIKILGLSAFMLTTMVGCYAPGAFEAVANHGGDILDSGFPLICPHCNIIFYGPEPTDVDFDSLVPSLNALGTWYLDLRDSTMPDASLSSVRRIRTLQVFAFQGSGARFTLNGLRQLKGMPSLSTLFVDRELFTDADAESLSASLPHVHVVRISNR